ncbi:hypothetical protein JK188_15585 [Providencia sp. JGM181]|uniref:hypothetical protein n=1 Tax=unclassified Providencia TaxID=2633465 RepID=UPI001BA4C8FE|nr:MULTISPECIES: hypothetical protein [unclassified Providencia]MBS0925908.1 hypothetical protein [Providencia sp. JGM181]MBS0934846.1 hypothetical protein [Providencia sp. JGM172]MBS0998985.1 hypothetical protein [Providencia sp. JGM178]
MIHTIMLTKPFLLSWNILSTIVIEHNFFLSNENHGQRSLAIQIAKMMWAKIPKMENRFPKQRVIKLVNSNSSSQSSLSSSFQLAKPVLFANRSNHQNTPFITSSKQHNFNPSNTLFTPLHDGILSAARYMKIETFHQQAHHLVTDKVVTIFGNIRPLESHQTLCKACLLCPQNIIDIKGFTQTRNSSLRGNSEISIFRTGAFQLGKNQ